MAPSAAYASSLSPPLLLPLMLLSNLATVAFTAPFFFSSSAAKSKRKPLSTAAIRLNFCRANALSPTGLTSVWMNRSSCLR